MLEIDRYALSRAAQFQAEVLAHYEVYEFHPVVAKLQVYCSEDLGAFYLDMLKDRLYTTAPKSLARRSAQTALWNITHAMLRWMAPFLSFTAEARSRETGPGADRRGKGVRVCILDSGVDQGHPLVGEIQQSVAVSVGPDDEVIVEEDTEGDICGHAPRAPGSSGRSRRVRDHQRPRARRRLHRQRRVLLAGSARPSSRLSTSINMSLSTTKHQLSAILHELDRHGVLPAHDARVRHNMPAGATVEVLLGALRRSHENPTSSPSTTTGPAGRVLRARRRRGGRVDRRRRTSLHRQQLRHAAHVGLRRARPRKHPELTPFQLKSVLYLTSLNVGGGR